MGTKYTVLAGIVKCIEVINTFVVKRWFACGYCNIL